jgi:thioesterase domain-containing protein
MLVLLQTSGTKPPLFFVHGIGGVMFSVGSNFARALGPNQPVYAIHAQGMDGRQPVIADARQMVVAYLDDIHRAWPTGPLRIGGMCAGCMIAVEVARKLQEHGRQTGPLILADPPVVPYGYDKRERTVDPRQPHIAERLYRETRGKLLDKASRGLDDLPFDPADSEQLHAATLAAVSTLIAFSRYIPTPFSGPVEMIISAEHAPGFFHPLMPWHKLLPGPRVVHVLPWLHHELFGAGRKAVARLMRFMLEEEPTAGRPVEREMQAALL